MCVRVTLPVTKKEDELQTPSFKAALVLGALLEFFLLAFSLALSV
jgi:hypothetical protein